MVFFFFVLLYCLLVFFFPLKSSFVFHHVICLKHKKIKTQREKNMKLLFKFKNQPTIQNKKASVLSILQEILQINDIFKIFTINIITIMQKVSFDKIPVKQLTPAEKVFRLVKDLIILLVTGGMIYGFNVFDVMINSKRIFRWLLYTSVACHLVGLALALYMTWVVAKTDPDFENCDPLIKKTTAAFAVGTVLWMIAVWPVFHFWTIPLGICFLFFTVTFVSLFSVERPRRKID